MPAPPRRVLADPDLIICGKLPGIAIARVGPRHDGQCVGYGCDSFVNPAVLARICDECNYGSFEGAHCPPRRTKALDWRKSLRLRFACQLDSLPSRIQEMRHSNHANHARN